MNATYASQIEELARQINEYDARADHARDERDNARIWGRISAEKAWQRQLDESLRIKNWLEAKREELGGE
jgi:hypothetical protein